MSANTPKHYGFAQVPRQILRGEKYKKKLSLAEKGLYSCLKDICGDTGECYYSLRNLATEIGTSASTLTRLIPALRDAGLIYAEKKVRGTAENRHEIWHIRIVNIWQENDALYQPEECSKMKQSSVSEENNTPSASTSVSNCNENTGLFQNETGLFQNEIKIVSFCLPNNNNSNNNLTKEEGTVSEITNAPDVASPIDHIASLPIDTVPTESKETSSKKNVKVTRQRKTEPLKKSAPKVEDMTPGAQRVWVAWLSMPWNKGVPPKLTETAIAHCEYLSSGEITADIMFKVRNFAKKNDRNKFYEGKSWELGDVVREYSRWQSAQYQAKPEEIAQKVTIGNKDRQSFFYNK